ncbi:hypothetical protein [Microbulbifer aggregans]|uniref:hypothetical protein n=1 Tax=Microbulbifer aggregans TaxID=1769779 RepID=UPI001CFD3809|nr:hypothetical protein [Microbulbifer aggregans]
MSKDAEELLDEIDETSFKSGKEIPIYWFTRRSNKTTKLVGNNKTENYLQSRNRAFGFEFERPMYVEYISVETEGYPPNHKADFSETLHLDNSPKESSRKLVDNKFILRVNNLLTSFSFKPEKTQNDAQIKRVTVIGTTLPELYQSLTVLGRIDAYKDEIYSQCQKKIEEKDAAESELRGIEEEKSSKESSIEELKSVGDALENSKQDLLKENEDLLLAISRKEKELESTHDRLSAVNDEIDIKIRESKGLNQEIHDRKSTLRALVNDINLFPTEISGFVHQGARNIRTYLILAFLPIALLVFVANYLFTSAAEFAEIAKTLTLDNVWSIFISRLPFVAISTAIIGACYKISATFVREIMRINSQRLNLSKVSIIAKDVSDSSSHDLEMDGDEIYEARTKLKMDLLKSHLKGYIDQGYEYQPSRKGKTARTEISNSVNEDESAEER